MNIEVTGELENAIKAHAARQGMSADSAARRLLTSVLMPQVGTNPPDDNRTGAALIEALQASPYRKLDIEPPRLRLGNVRNVEF